MGKNKLARFAEMKGFSCVFEPAKREVLNQEFDLRGKWREAYFGNDRPITLELGCGKGEYTLALAGQKPDENFIGIDVKGARLWRGAKTVQEEGMENVAFVRTKIEFINSLFAKDEVDEIWLTFSDPQPKDKKGTKRLTGTPFLKRYAGLLKPGGLIHVKTDSRLLYDSTLETLQAGGHRLHKQTDDLYGSGMSNFSPQEREILRVKTFYERKWLEEGKNIHYLRFSLNESYHKNIGEEQGFLRHGL
jgi:tRNA (guanine-N7-)-methyltransferase